MAIILKKIKPVFKSIRLRLVAIYFIMIAMVLSVLVLFILNSIRTYTINTFKKEMLKNVNIMASFAAESFKEGGTPFLPSASWGYKEAGLVLLDRDGRVVFDETNAAMRRGKILTAPWVLGAFEGENNTQETVENGAHYMHAAVPVYSGTEVVAVLIAGTSTETQYTFFAHMQKTLLIAAGFALFLLGLFGFFLSAIFTAPLSKLTGTIKKMSETDSRQPVHIRGGKEITELVTAFNKMVERTQDIEARRQEFVSNASHELKTPLSSIKLICDSLLQNPDTDREMVQEFLSDMNGQVDRLTRIINKLLSLTKLDSSPEDAEIFAFSTVNLHTLVSGVIKALMPLAQNKNIMMESRLQENVFLRIDADKIWEAVYNILDNSIKYTPQDGRVYTELYRDDENVYITIADNGIGMADTEFSKIFDRFYRVDKARARETGGTGLGLSIALSAVELHGGYIEVESREEEGSLFRIILPQTTAL